MQLILVRQIIENLQQKLADASFIFQRKKHSDEAIQEQYQMAVTKFQSVQKRLKEVEKRINFINQALEKSDVYKENSKCYALWKSAKNPDRYRKEHEMELAMYEGAKMWFDKYYHGKVPNVHKKKTELVKLEAEKYNLQQEYQSVKTIIQERRKVVLKRQGKVSQSNEGRIQRER